MRINYIDPGLYLRAGHHLQWFERMARELAARGHELRAYVHRQARPETLEAVSRYAEAVPLFGVHPYAPPEKVDPICGELSLFIATLRSLPAELRQVGPADAWLWPTLFAPQLAALATADIKVPVGACIYWAPQFPWQMGPSVWRYGALQAAKAGLKLRIAVGASELVPLYSGLLGGSPPVLPIPIDAGPPPALRSSLETVGFFGQQRQRKGSELLPQLTSQLLERGFKLVVHDSSRQAGSGGASNPNLKVLGYVEDLASEISRCDLVVAPYDPVKYRHMTSGIVWEAISRGIPVVAPAETCPGNFVEQLGAGTTFRSFDVEGIVAAIVEARTRYPAIRQAAFRACEEWPTRHGVGHCLSALLHGTFPAGHQHAEAPTSTVVP